MVSVSLCGYESEYHLQHQLWITDAKRASALLDWSCSLEFRVPAVHRCWFALNAYCQKVNARLRLHRVLLARSQMTKMHTARLWLCEQMLVFHITVIVLGCDTHVYEHTYSMTCCML